MNRLLAALGMAALAGASTVLAAYRSPVWSQAGMVATPHPEATRAGADVLARGGNAVDAALAAVFALSVVEPYHSGLGGGEFALVWDHRARRAYALDARECAPTQLHGSAADSTGKPAAKPGALVGVPGSVAGRIALWKRFGKLPLPDIVAGAIRLARDGFVVDRYLDGQLSAQRERFAEDPFIKKVFFRGEKPLVRGMVLRQAELAKTLERLAKDQGESFYRGSEAQAMVQAVQGAGGTLSLSDLATYTTVWRAPISLNYRGYTIYSMPPPSSGGLCLALILNILEGFPMGFIEPGEAEHYHLLASAFEFAFADRAAYLGDPAFNPQPVGMASSSYAETLRRNINRHARNPVRQAGNPWVYQPEDHTSHVSVVDRDGNMCAITTSINSAFGSGVYVPELGIFMNNTLDDFVLQPDTPNQYGLVGTEVNAPEPGKRPLSSMSPTLVVRDGKPLAALGSVGGPRIITSVAQILVNVIDHGMDLQAAVDFPRAHMQWRPDTLYLEEAIPPEVVRELRIRGWNVVRQKQWSLSQAVMISPDGTEFWGASDARGVGTAEPSQAP